MLEEVVEKSVFNEVFISFEASKESSGLISYVSTNKRSERERESERESMSIF